jgi:hypothetical protein
MIGFKFPTSHVPESSPSPTPPVPKKQEKQEKKGKREVKRNETAQ